MFVVIAVASVDGVPIDWNFFSKSTSEAPKPSTEPPKLPNNLLIGECEEDDNVSKLFDYFHSSFTNINLSSDNLH